VVTSTLVFEGGGRVNEYVGGYTDWVRQRKPTLVAAPPKRVSSAPAPAKAPRKRKLTFKETAELTGLPERIDALERDRDAVYLSLADPQLVRDGAAMGEARSRLAALEREIAVATERWEELETIAAG
jgi:ABC transport system ATP-binding/permease protein